MADLKNQAFTTIVADLARIVGEYFSKDIKEHMDVIGSCGDKLGVVDHVEGSFIKLTRADNPDGHHHLIPTSWVAKVDKHVRLCKNCGEAKKEWLTV